MNSLGHMAGHLPRVRSRWLTVILYDTAVDEFDLDHGPTGIE